MSTCGKCKFSKLVPNDMKLRFCHGAPPTPIPMPTRGANGATQLTMQMLRPVVSINEEACALFEERFVGGVADIMLQPANKADG